MAVGGDLALPEILGTPALSTRIFNLYVDRVLAAAEHDVATFEQFVHVAWLVDSPLSLLRPSIVRRAVMARRRRPAAGRAGDVASDAGTDRWIDFPGRHSNSNPEPAPAKPDGVYPICDASPGGGAAGPAGGGGIHSVIVGLPKSGGAGGAGVAAVAGGPTTTPPGGGGGGEG